MTQLTKNFSLHELTKSETALRYDMPNDPGSVEVANLVDLAAKDCRRCLPTPRCHEQFR